MLVAVVILVLYFWAYFADVKSIGDALLVSDAAAIMAAVSLAAGFVSYLWAPKKYIFWGSLAAFAILALTSATLVLNTGGMASPFIALWMIVSVFAAVFGIYGMGPLLLAVGAYMVYELNEGVLGTDVMLAILLTGVLPLGISYLIWHAKFKEDPGENKTYHELASELSQVAGKSEVVINAIADGVIALDSHGVIQLINPAAQQIIGWGKQDALALDYKSVLKLLDKNDNELVPATDPIGQVLATNKEVAAGDLSLVTKSGKKLLVSVVVSPVGQPGSGVIVVFRDVTMEKREERQQAEFISTAAHEMRTPVASIEGYLGLALNPNTAQIDEKARDFISKAHQSAQHLGSLFQDLLDISKAEDGRLTNNPKVVDVVAFTHDIVDGLQPKAQEKGLRMVFKPLPDKNDEKTGERRLNPVFYANVDNDHLREIVANLVENAIKYTPEGDVAIDVTGDDSGHVVISVADSGIGIPKEDQAHLFQKFYRVDNSDTREIGGTGLGLYLCRRLAEAMNGRIWVDSEYKRGSTFYLEIPRIEHEEAMRMIEAASMQEETQAATQQAIGEAMPTLPTSPSNATAQPDGGSPAAAQAQATPSGAAPANASSPPEKFSGASQTEPASNEISTPSTVAPPPPAADETYTSAPAALVAQQLQSINTSAAPQAPVIQPAPQQAAPARPNVPLTSIEQNPHEYIRNRPDGIPIPPRNQK